jgi:membrane protein required for colicin V production
VLALAGWVLAFLAARWSAPLVGQWLPMGESPEPLRHAVPALPWCSSPPPSLCGLLAALARRASQARWACGRSTAGFGALFGLLRGVLACCCCWRRRWCR